jgi:hypothetical protein
MTPTKIRAAEALYPLLSPFHAVAGRILCGIRHVSADGCLDQIILDFGAASLIVTADENDDSIEVEITERVHSETNLEGMNSNHAELWKAFIGRSFGWGWITVNQQGYCDGLLLSFEGINPQLLLNVVASSIKASKIVAIQ